MENGITPQIFSVTEITRSIKALLELQYRFVHIQGEVSNLRIPYSGHMYFTLKDETAQIRAVLFKSQKRYLQGDLREGQSIICHGRISVYEQRGEYQIIVDTVNFAGHGSLQLQFERLKKKLSNEGLFDRKNKKPIPSFPESVAVITSPTGAALQDFLKISKKRNYWGHITIVPVTVQGKSSAQEIADAIEHVNDALQVDVVILIRGGGSIEDLWSFNEEVVARAIHVSAIPVITGIGHETDYTIADMCADEHTHTPTAAAEFLLPDKLHLLDNIDDWKRSLRIRMDAILYQKKQQVNGLKRVIGDLELYISHHTLRLDHQQSRLINGVNGRLLEKNADLVRISEKLQRLAPHNRIDGYSQRLEHLKQEMVHGMKRQLERKIETLAKQAALLDSCSPLSILARGYSVLRQGDDVGTVISDAEQVEIGDVVDVLLHRGGLECEVKKRRVDN